MRRILVATDFSARSDRAIRRATLLARTYGSSMTVVHVIDDDQPKRIVKAEREASSVLLSEQARSLREIDGVNCDYSIVLGNAFEGIAKAAEEINCDLLVIGPHRRQALKDVFVGTTAERTIRASNWPVLMANGVPAGSYRHVLVAVDLSDCSADAVRAVTGLGLEKHAAISVAHVVDAPATRLMSRASMTEDQVKDYLADVEERASDELGAFLANLKFHPIRRIVKHNSTSVAHTISSVAREVSADLVVVGTHGRTGITKLLLGSVAEEVLRTADHDVLAVPPRATAKEGAA
jgi:nucleotide-binding universal stress UspA family protein